MGGGVTIVIANARVCNHFFWCQEVKWIILFSRVLRTWSRHSRFPVSRTAGFYRRGGNFALGVPPPRLFSGIKRVSKNGRSLDGTDCAYMMHCQPEQPRWSLPPQIRTVPHLRRLVSLSGWRFKNFAVSEEVVRPIWGQSDSLPFKLWHLDLLNPAGGFQRAGGLVPGLLHTKAYALQIIGFLDVPLDEGGCAAPGWTETPTADLLMAVSEPWYA